MGKKGIHYYQLCVLQENYSGTVLCESSGRVWANFWALFRQGLGFGFGQEFRQGLGQRFGLVSKLVFGQGSDKGLGKGFGRAQASIWARI